MIEVENIGKRFVREWIFRRLSYTFKIGEPVAITGSNGSGKSTLIKALAGTIPINEGKINYFKQGQTIEEDQWHRHIGISAPYLELIEEFSLYESIEFHIKFRPFIYGLDTKEFISLLGFEKHRNKYIRDFSSGMKQRLKLGFVFFTQNEILFLDEPTANLDQSGYEWYMQEVIKHVPNKIVLISSNEPKEYTFCTKHLSILDFKG